MNPRAGFTVAPLSKRVIFDRANSTRERFRSFMGGARYVPIAMIYETLPLFVPGFELEVCEADEMGGDHGQTFPEKRVIRLRRDVYDGMCRGQGRDRFTAAHELGHLFLHQGAAFSRKAPDPNSPAFVNSEWQANTFASAFLIDEQFVGECQSLEEVQRVFGVSRAAAEARFPKEEAPKRWRA